MTRLSLTALGLILGTALAAPISAHAQEFLTRAEVEAILRESVLCYYPNDRFACAWAEIYTEFHADHTILFSASAAFDQPMEVSEYRIDWRGDALCIPYEDQGLRSVREAEGYRFPFDLEGLTERPADELPGIIAELQANSPREFCFQYTNDPAYPGRLLQYVFRDGVADAEFDPVALIPLFAHGVSIAPN